MKRTGIHIIIMLSLITGSISFLSAAEGFIFDCSIFAILLGVPTFVVMDLFYIIISVLRKRDVQIIYSLGDLIIIVLSIWIWGYIVYSHLLFVKTMVNYIESGVIAMSACALYAIRCFYAYKGNLRKINLWQKISFVVIPVIAILLAILFPGIPE